jgi:DNA polymerase-1
VQPDGFVHPDINTLQASGRKSTTDPGLTVWTSRGVNAIEKAYFIPDDEDSVLIEFDLSQADARIVAAYSGDEAFAMRFAEGVDAHMLTAEAIWGYDVVHASHETEAHYRQIAKACGHAYAFRAGPGTIARTAKVAFSIAKKFVNTMQRLYPKVTRWQDKVTQEARRGFVVNAWGRKLRIDKNREYTQGPAMYGQSGTMEIINDALRRMPIFILRYLKAQVHDALVFSFPRDKVAEYSKIVVDCMEVTWQPPDGTGQAVFFPVGMSKNLAATDWYEAGH